MYYDISYYNKLSKNKEMSDFIELFSCILHLEYDIIFTDLFYKHSFIGIKKFLFYCKDI